MCLAGNSSTICYCQFMCKSAIIAAVIRQGRKATGNWGQQFVLLHEGFGCANINGTSDCAQALSHHAGQDAHTGSSRYMAPYLLTSCCNATGAACHNGVHLQAVQLPCVKQA